MGVLYSRNPASIFRVVLRAVGHGGVAVLHHIVLIHGLASMVQEGRTVA